MRQRVATERAEGTDIGVPGMVYRWVQRTDNLSLMLLDIGIVAVAWLLGFAAGFASRVPLDVQNRAVLVLGLPVLVQVVVNRVAGLYGPVWRYASVEEGIRVIVAVVAGTASSTVLLVAVARVTSITLPLLTAPPVAALLVLLGYGGVRFQSRLFAIERQRSRSEKPVKALIIGAGSAGAALAYELTDTESGRDVCVVGFVDDDVRMRRRSVRGIPVLGDTTMLEALCTTHHIDRILIALPGTDKEDTKPIVDRALRTNAQVKVLRPASDHDSGLSRHVRDLDLTDLLGREAAPVDSEDIAHYLQGATVLITGAARRMLVQVLQEQIVEAHQTMPVDQILLSARNQNRTG